MDDARQHAQVLFEEGYHRQMAGDVDAALELYTRSIATFPTPEAYTFRGWAYSFQGNYSAAIAECKRAIALDPEYGNPYNDIGAYLIEQGRLDDAIPWLERATRARRYASPFFPLFNLGRAYERKRLWSKAAVCYEQALATAPQYRPAKQALARLRGQWN